MVDLTNASEHLNFLEEFIKKYPILSAFIFPIVASWLLTAFVKPWFPKGPHRARNIRTFDGLVAAALAVWLLHELFGWNWVVTLAIIIGPGSPTVYWVLAGLVCWKWPKAKRFLTLRELAPEHDEVKDARPTQPSPQPD